jgi:hypothetical protein
MKLRWTVTDDFVVEVQVVVGPLMADLGFTVDEIDSNVDEWGRQGSVVYYRSDDCKLHIYQSSREGSLNCMIAPLVAPNQFGPRDRSGKWQYLPRYAIWRGVSPKEIMKDKLPVDFPSTTQFLESVRRRIEKYYPVAHSGVLEMYRQGD